MENYFDTEIRRLKRELTALKTSAQTSASEVITTVQSMDFNIPLTLDNPYLATGTVWVRVTANGNNFFMATLDQYYEDVVNYRDCRNAYCEQFFVGDGQWLIYLEVEGDQNDINTLAGGGSVSIPRTLTVRSTDEFTMEVV